MFWYNFVNQCNLKSTTPTAVVKKLNISAGSVTGWKEGSIPRDTTLKKIADYFNITVAELLSENEKKPVHVDELKQGSLSTEVKILLKCFEKASEDDQRVIWTVLDKYMSPNEKEYFSQSKQTDHVG